MSALDGSIVIIALPAIFRGIHLDPLAPGNVSYLLWMIMGYRLVQAVLVVTVGRLGDMFGRVRIYNAGFAVFTVASVLLSFDPFHGWPRGAVADRLAGAPGHRRVDAHRQLGRDPDRCLSCRPARVSRSASTRSRPSRASSSAWSREALLAALDWRAVFWVNVPVGVFGTRVGLPQAPRQRRAASRPHRLVGQHHVRPRPGRHPGRHHRRHPAVRGSHHGLDEPGGGRLAGRQASCCWRRSS